MSLEENKLPILSRFWIYQKERFPLVGHGLLIASFSFSAISYSRICRGKTDFIEFSDYLAVALTCIALFFLLRVFDEFKDKEDDAKYRKHLPVPRGLISFSELKNMGIIAIVIQLLINIFWQPSMLLLYLLPLGYLLLMWKEFFVAEWLKKHQFWYVVSHMLIIPLIDIYASGYDWKLEGVTAPKGLLFFFAVSFMNGLVLEVGRKIRTKDKEEFNTYSTKFGAKKATQLFLLMLVLTYLFSLAAAYYANYGTSSFIVLSVFLLLCSLPAILFLKEEKAKTAKFIEYASALWTIAMYLTLGGGPMINQLFFK
jgi:4-hydroxybenzoate polyprenyltransferase